MRFKCLYNSHLVYNLVLFILSLLATNWMRKGDLTHCIYAAPPLPPILKMLGITLCLGGGSPGGGGDERLRSSLSTLNQQYLS
jgi:hypothetical protein